MNCASNAMPNPVAYDTKTCLKRNRFNSMSNITKMNPWAARGNSCSKATLCRLYKLKNLGICNSKRNSTRSISIEAILENTDIGLNKIAWHYHPIAARNAMDYLFIDRNAKMPRETMLTLAFFIMAT